MTKFADLGLSEKALSAVKRMGYDQPTPVQEQAIPLVLKGRDLEKIVLSRAVTKHIQRKILTYKNKTIIFS